MASPHYLGIDFGTTATVAASVGQTGSPTSLVNFEGDVLTPSAVWFDQQNPVVGREALKAAVRNPTQCALYFKRDLGKDCFSREIAGVRYRPELLSALVLRRLQGDVSRQLGSVQQIALSVPAAFDYGRRIAIQNASRIAGWETVHLINEPAAAALADAHHRLVLGESLPDRERILVYDLGGASFDVTVIEVRRGERFRTRAIGREPDLGGCDWDRPLVQFLAKQFFEQTKLDPLETLTSRIVLLNLAQQIKHTLSARPVEIRPCSLEGQRAKLHVTRDELERLTRPLLDRTRNTTQRLLESSGLKARNIDRVLLVGGATRMPMVSQMLEDLLGQPPATSVSADEVIAHGAAIYARSLNSKEPVEIVNVSPQTLRVVGVRHGRRLARAMINRHTKLPARNTLVFPVSQSGQDSIKMEVCLGESEQPELCEPQGVLTVRGIPSKTNKRWQVSVKLTCQSDGLIQVKASVLDPDDLGRTVKEVSTNLRPNCGLTEEELLQAQRQLDSFSVG